jgi:CRISPR/Cas system-associated exonuclease Cas4 (RecB family)
VQVSDAGAAPSFYFYKDNLMYSLATLRAEPHTSVSRVKSYLACPRRYFYQYIERLAPAFRPLALVFGTAWHETLGEHLLHTPREGDVPLEKLRAHLRDGLVRGIAADGIPVLFEEEEQDVGAVVDTALRMLDAFITRVPLPRRVHGVELAFRLELADSISGETYPEPLIGALDAVVDEDGRAVVWELKSGKRKWTQDALDFDLQPTAYRIAARALGHADAGVVLLVTTKGKVPAVQREVLPRHDRDEREFVDVVFSVRRAVHAGVDHPLRGWQCRSCGYAGVCAS